jgi:ubiquinol-cytochrome c reductase iron-sulfur subunit
MAPQYGGASARSTVGAHSFKPASPRNPRIARRSAAESIRRRQKTRREPVKSWTNPGHDAKAPPLAKQATPSRIAFGVMIRSYGASAGFRPHLVHHEEGPSIHGGEITMASMSADGSRRDFLYIATGAVGAVGVASAIWPFVSQLGPDATTRAAGAPIEVDLSQIPEGQSITLKWRGLPIFVRHRTAKEIQEAKADDAKGLPDPEKDADRVGKLNNVPQDKWIIVQGSCTHLGCVPVKNAGDYEGWYCPCHGSHYDTAGRIRKGPAPKNLVVPEYAFLNEGAVRITGTRSAA